MCAKVSEVIAKKKPLFIPGVGSMSVSYKDCLVVYGAYF